ncbi:unnamed protein product, partial [Rotaria sp. Silwood2]
QPILICAETHQAVDNLTRHLLQYRQYRLIRYGEPRTVASDLRVIFFCFNIHFFT